MLAATASCTCGRGGGRPPPAPVRPPPTLAAASFRLANGLEVELVSGPCGEDDVAVITLFAVGADHDPVDRSGMARVVARLLSAPGGATRVESGSDHTSMSVVVHKDRLAAELDALAARMPRLDATGADLARARSEVLVDLASMRGGDPAQTARSYAAESVHPTRGNGWQGGVATELEEIDLAQAQAFWRAQYVPGNARLVIVGPFDAAAVRSRIEAAFATWSPGSAPAPREPADATVTGTLVFGDAPSALAVAVSAPAPSDALYPAFLVLAARLLAPVSPARSWEASYDPIARPETLFVSAQVPPGPAPEAAATAVRAELSALLAQPLAPADFTAAKDRFGLLLGLHALEPATCAAEPRAFALARARRAQLGLSALHLGEALDATTQAQLDEAAARFGPRRSAAVVAGGTIR